MFRTKRTILMIVLLAAAASIGCGDNGERDAVLGLLEQGEYEQVVQRTEALRQAGVVAPWLDRAEGLANLSLGQENLARRQLADAVAADSSLAKEIAAVWASAALEDHEQGYRDRARERMALAIVLDPSTDPGPTLASVADYLYRFDKNYEAAYPLYKRLYEERPEPASWHPQWVYRWGYCLEITGDLAGARAVYEEFMETFPDERQQSRYVHWRYIDVLMEQARQAREAGDLDGALDLLALTRMDNWHLDQQQRAEYLAGQICEQKGDLAAAREHYEQVVSTADRMGSEVVEPARERLEALDALDAN